MSTVKIKQRLRPLRLAFLVSATDDAMLRRVIETNTALWGGQFNAIIPVFADGLVPVAYADMSNQELIEKYLEVFEPDYVIETMTERFLSVDELMNRQLAMPGYLNIDQLFDLERATVTLGLSVSDLFIDLYQQQFQYTTRSPRLVTFTDSVDTFLCAAYGKLPTETTLAKLRSQYVTVFDAKQADETCETFASTMFYSRILTELTAGSMGLLTPRTHDFDWRLLLIDDTNPADIMEYWNLRALGRHVLPIPMRWQNELAEAVVQRIRSHLPTINLLQMGVYTICHTASVKHNVYGEYFPKLEAAPANAVSSLSTNLAPWEIRRNDVSADIVESSAKLDDDERFTFESLSPSFAPQNVRVERPRWANLMEIDRGAESNEAGVVLPLTISDIRSLFQGKVGWFRLTEEGIVMLCHYNWHKSYWKMPTNLDVMKAAFASDFPSIELSDKGSTAYEMIKRLGGLRAVELIANMPLIELFNSTTRGSVNYEGTVIAWENCWSLLQKLHKNDNQAAEKHLKQLLLKKALRLGLKIQCPKCKQYGWHALNQLSDEILCRRCLQEFEFPCNKPRDQKWSYHTLGPFSTSDYAMGSYSVVLALRYLIIHLGATASWVPNVDIRDASNGKCEADFLAFWRDSYAPPEDIETIIGECKSTGCFDEKDWERAENFYGRFPDAYFVFASLVSELCKPNREWLAEFAEKANVIVLTREELTIVAQSALTMEDLTGVDEEGNLIGRSGLLRLAQLTRKKLNSTPS